MPNPRLRRFEPSSMAATQSVAVPTCARIHSRTAMGLVRALTGMRAPGKVSDCRESIGAGFGLFAVRRALLNAQVALTIRTGSDGETCGIVRWPSTRQDLRRRWELAFRGIAVRFGDSRANSLAS